MHSQCFHYHNNHRTWVQLIQVAVTEWDCLSPFVYACKSLQCDVPSLMKCKWVSDILEHNYIPFTLLSLKFHWLIASYYSQRIFQQCAVFAATPFTSPPSPQPSIPAFMWEGARMYDNWKIIRPAYDYLRNNFHDEIKTEFQITAHSLSLSSSTSSIFRPFLSLLSSTSPWLCRRRCRHYRIQYDEVMLVEFTIFRVAQTLPYRH